MKSGIIWLLLISGAFFSCKRQNGNIVIQGQGEGFGYKIFRTDSLNLFTITVREDSLPANGLPYSLIGTMNDPLLGKTTASVYAATSIYEPLSDFPNTDNPDSAVLYIPIIDGLNFYGNRLSEQSWNIYPLVNKIDGGLVYYQHLPPQISNNNVSFFRGRIFSSSYDSVKYKNGKMEVHAGIRIKLSNSMAGYLMHMPKEAYQQDDNLNKYLPGMAIVPQDNDLSPGEGGIGVFEMTGSNVLGSRAHIMLYYHDTETFVFTFSGVSKTLTGGKTGPYPDAVNTQLNKGSQTYPVTYVQSLSGLKTKITFPDLYTIGNGSNIAINKATLTFYIDPSSINHDFAAPPRLNLFRPPNALSDRNYLVNGGTLASFGGIYDETNGSYTFNITQHIQDLFNAKYMDNLDLNYGLFLSVPTASPVLAARAAIDQSRTKLTITYTKLN